MSLQLVDDTQLKDLTKTVMTVLSNWSLESEQQMSLLGLPENTPKRALGGFRNGSAVPKNPDFLHRAQCILAIQNAVDSIYPHNAYAANCWVTTQNLFFAYHTPLDIMLSEGLEGMKRVVDHLNGTEDWGNPS